MWIAQTKAINLGIGIYWALDFSFFIQYFRAHGNIGAWTRNQQEDLVYVQIFVTALEMYDEIIKRSEKCNPFNTFNAVPSKQNANKWKFRWSIRRKRERKLPMLYGVIAYALRMASSI